MSNETLAKIIKAFVVCASLAGYQIDPDQIDTILQGAASVYAAVTAVEAWIKHRAA